MERERDLAAALRAELAAVDPARECCRRAERNGLAAPRRGRARSAAVARLALRLESGSGADGGFRIGSAPEHCSIAWLRGRFLAHGSLSLTPSGTHLELVVPAGEAAALCERLGRLGLGASWRSRRGQGVITWKGREAVLAFLRRAGATASALELESLGVTRSLRGHLNRVLNAESANLQRSVASAARQVAAIRALEASGSLERLPQFDRAVARLRCDAPEQTLTELARRLEVSRARVQRALERLEALADRESVVGSVR